MIIDQTRQSNTKYEKAYLALKVTVSKEGAACVSKKSGSRKV